MAKTKVNSFIKEFKARLNGDNATVIAEKAWRQSKNALTAEIAVSEGDLITYEDALEMAQERLAAARVNESAEIIDRAQYVRNLVNAKNNVTIAEENLQEKQERLAFLKEQLASLELEVDEE